MHMLSPLHAMSTSNMATRRLQPNDAIFSLVLFIARCSKHGGQLIPRDVT